MRMLGIEAPADYYGSVVALFDRQRWWIRPYQEGKQYDVRIRVASPEQPNPQLTLFAAEEGANDLPPDRPPRMTEKSVFKLPLPAVDLIKAIEMATKKLSPLLRAPLHLNREEGTLIVNDRVLRLNPKQQDLLQVLICSDDGEDTSNGHLSALLSFTSTHALAVQISRLRGFLPAGVAIQAFEADGKTSYRLIL